MAQRRAPRWRHWGCHGLGRPWAARFVELASQLETSGGTLLDPLVFLFSGEHLEHHVALGLHVVCHEDRAVIMATLLVQGANVLETIGLQKIHSSFVPFDVHLPWNSLSIRRLD